MRLSYDPAKRMKTLEERGLDFEDAGPTLELQDLRKDYGELRVICYGVLAGRLVVVGYTTRLGTRRIFSMRKANAREKELVWPALGV
ncbi:MAG: hypothetical protein RL026_584 [Pseudomonadota bacterium]|jgi:uncharacterized DUF497 family protein